MLISEPQKNVERVRLYFGVLSFWKRLLFAWRVLLGRDIVVEGYEE